MFLLAILSFRERAALSQYWRVTYAWLKLSLITYEMYGNFKYLFGQLHASTTQLLPRSHK